MTPTRQDFEAMMPQPGAAICLNGGSAVGLPYYTAAQMLDIAQAADKAATERALDAAYNAMFDLKGDKATRFDAQTAIRKLKDAAAIRGTE